MTLPIVITRRAGTVVVARNADAVVIVSQKGPAGLPGRNAAAGMVFGWPGLLIAGEPPQSQTAPSAGTFSTSSPGSCDVPATFDTTFTLTINGVGAGTVLFAAGAARPVFNFSNPVRPAGAKVTAIPPVTPDPTLAGPNFTLIDL